METQPKKNEIVKRAVEAGINYFDTTWIEETKSLGLALKALGKKTSSRLESRLKLLETNRIDIFNLFSPENSYSREKFEATMEVLKEMKEEGKIGWIGSSSHDPRFLAELIRKYDCFDSVMIRYNYHLQEAREMLFPLCKALEIGVVVMKPFC